MTVNELPTRSHYRATFAVLATAVGAYALLQSLVIPALPTLQSSLHTSQNTVTWVLTAYLLSASIFTPIMGRLGDMYGKERMLIAALAALAVGSLLSALAGSIGLMLVGRVIQGIGGGVVPLSFGIVRDEFPREKVAGAIGIVAALAAAGAGLGIVLAGPIVDALGYRWLFWIPMIVLVAACIAAKVVVPESPVRLPGKLNWFAAILLSGWLVALLLPISEAPVWGWESLRVIGLILLAVVLMVVWVVVESRSSYPLVDMTMMRMPAVWTANLVALLFGVGLYAIFAFMPEFLQAPPSAGYGFGLSITHSGLTLLPLSILMFTFGAVSGRLTARLGSKAVLIMGSTISVIPFVMIVLANGLQWEIVLAMALMGAGFGLAFAGMSNLIVEGVRPEQTGVASGMNANIRTVGGSIGAAVIGSVVTASSHHGSLPHKSGYTHGFEVLAGAAIVGALAALLVPSARRSLSHDEARGSMLHSELAMLAAGTLVDQDPE